jgi:hypothetical protein
MKKPFLLYVGVAAASLATGIFVGHWTAPVTTIAKPETHLRLDSASTRAGKTPHENARDKDTTPSTLADAPSPKFERDQRYRELLTMLAAPADASRSTTQAFADASALVLAAWAKEDPIAAADAVRAEPGALSAHAETVLREIGKTDAALAWKLAAECGHDHPETAQATYAGALQGILDAGEFRSAAGLLDHLDDAPGAAPYRDFLATVLAREWGRNDPQAAAAWALALPAASSDMREQVLVGLGQSWSQIDPEAAARFVTQLPPGPLRQTVVTQTLLNWASGDAPKASAWLNSFEPHPDFDQPVHDIAVIASYTKGDWDTALSWANSIFDEQLRVQGLAEVLSHWSGRDHAAAAAYLETSLDLSPGIREKVREQLARLGPQDGAWP